jgi:hypothetical protein
MPPPTAIVAGIGKWVYHSSRADEQFCKEGRVMNADNRRYWFRAKRYGLGWGLPLAWQGWAVFVSWLLITPMGLRFLTPGSSTARWAFIAAMLTLLIVICYWKGEPTGRRWNSGDGN